ncbi:MAG: hypothetical protein PHE24_05965 [Patescibacteria group bacterium]|nr:hypothetical protein [Patescibacteria group bacterium]
MTKKIKGHLFKMRVFYFLAMFFIAAVVLSVSNVYAAPLPVAAPYAEGDNLIGATNASWTFAGDLAGTLVNGDMLRFIFPTINNGTPFSISNPTVVATSGIILFSSPEPMSSKGVQQGSFSGGEGQPPRNFIFGYVHTTIATDTAISATFNGINNPLAQRADVAADHLTWQLSAGTPQMGPPTLSFTSTSTHLSGNTALIRSGGNMIVDQNTNITASAYTLGTTNVTYTFTFTPTSSIPVGAKIIIGFPFAYNDLLDNASISGVDIISNNTATTIASFSTSTLENWGNVRVTLVTAGADTNAGDVITIKIYGVTNPATAGVYGAGSGGPESRFVVYTAKANDGVMDGSPFGMEEGDNNNGPAPDRAVHIGGTNNVNILVYKQSGSNNVRLSDSEVSQVLVGLGCPDKGFFVGQKRLATTTTRSFASYNNVLDCNYIVETEPNDKSDSSFYANFLVPAQKQVPVIGGNVTATTSIVFGVPDASSTLMITNGVVGKQAFVQAYSADFMSFSPIFNNENCTGEPSGFDAGGVGYACLNIKSGENWNFSVIGGDMNNSANFTDISGNEYWPPTISSVYIASAGHTDLGPYAYVKADKTLTVNVLKAGTETGVNGACIGVAQGGGAFMGPQNMTCNINSKAFKVPLGSVNVEVGLPGYGAPQNYPVAITGNSTTKNIYVSQPTSYIAVVVRDSSGNRINGAPVFANGNGNGQGMTNSNGVATIYVMPGNYIVQGFAPGLGQLTPNNVTVSGGEGSHATTTFIINTASLGTVAGRMFTDANDNGIYDVGVDTALSGIQIGAHRIDGTNGGNGTQTDANGNYTLYLPAGIYEVGGWSSSLGGFQASPSLTVTGGESTSLNVPLKGQGTLHIKIRNASNLSPLFAGVFDPSTGRGNGTNSWTASSTSKIANLTLPAGTYNFNAGSPVIGEIISTSTIITVGGTTNITVDANTVAALVTISGNVKSGATNIANATVWAAKMGGRPGFFSTSTDSDGNYSLKVPANSAYRVGIKILGYIVNDVSTTTAALDKTVNFSLIEAGGIISGSVVNNSSAAITNAWVSAKKIVGAGQMDVWAGGPTDGNGDFSLNVDSGNWTVFAGAPCYQQSTGVTIAVNASTAITLSAVSGCSANAPEMQGITPTTGGQVAKNDMSLDIPANALGTGSGTISLSFGTTSPRAASNATALPNSVQRITAVDSTGQSITSLNNNASLSITYKESDLPTGFDEGNLQLGYFDETSGQWEPVASTVDTTNKKITASISHFTDYAPIMPNVPTAPAGLTATAISTSQIDLSWTASTPISADYYIIYASTTAITTFPASALIATTTSTSYSHSSLSATQTWYYKVAGYNANGEGWNSSRANATTQTPSCSTLTGAATYNAYPTCGAATCSSGYTLSGSGASATCAANSSGGSGGLSAVHYCATVTYGDWGGCVSNWKYRDVLTKSPIYCTLTADQEAVRKMSCVLAEPTATTTAEIIKNEAAPAAGNTAKQAQDDFVQKLTQILSEAAIVIKADVNALVAAVGSVRDLGKESLITNKYITALIKNQKVSAVAKTILIDFVAYGTPTTKPLGEGERAGVVDSYKAAFSKLPATEAEWQDVIKIANGRWPGETNAKSEAWAKTQFKKVYLRVPNMNNTNDSAAVKIMAYGLRPANRNLNSEKAAIKSFKFIYGYTPKTASAWDIVRAIAYSGAKR